jgi:histone H1/5
MADTAASTTAAAPAAAAQAKKPAKPRVAKPAGSRKPKSSNPTYIQMILNAIRSLKEVKGSSRQSIVKYIVSTYKIDQKMASIHVNLAIKKGITGGLLKHGKSNNL